MTSKKYCADLQGGMWLRYNPTNKNWYAKPCCLYKRQFVINSDINKEFWNHPDIVKERQENLNNHDLPINCIECKQTENASNYSRRQAWNDRLGTQWNNPESVIEIDIQSDFTCNLACRICGPELSTKWRQISVTPKNTDVKKFKVRADNNNAVDIINTIPVDNIQQIHFQGGEPFLTNTHIELLERLEQRVDLSQIVVWYHTNGTTRVTDKVLKFWEKFKMVEIYFSLDDMGTRMEYQRWPLVWNEVHENMLWYKNNLPHNGLLRIERTIGVLNAYWAEELDQWHNTYFTHTKYTDPITLSYHLCHRTFGFESMTTEYITAILEKLPENHWVHNTAKTYLNKENPRAIKSMLATLNEHDIIRGQKWQEIYPEFLEWYKRYL